MEWALSIVMVMDYVAEFSSFILYYIYGFFIE